MAAKPKPKSKATTRKKPMVVLSPEEQRKQAIYERRQALRKLQGMA